MATQAIPSRLPRMMPTMSINPTAESDPIPAPAWVSWLGVFTAAGLLYLCYFPVAIGALAWIALVPWLVLVRLPAGTGRPK